MTRHLLLAAAIAVSGCGAAGRQVRAEPVRPEPIAAPAPAVSPVPAVASEVRTADEEVQPAAARSPVTEQRNPTPKHARAPAPRARRGTELARRAAALVGVESLSKVTREVPDDCTGFVRYVYESSGIDLMELPPGQSTESGVAAIYRRARIAGALHKKNPRPGDLVFFRETYDRNRDGQRNDGLTHIGIVEAVAPDGTVTFIHRGSKGIARSHLNPKFPKARRTRKGAVLNDYLRRQTEKVRAYLTGELFSSFGSPDRL